MKACATAQLARYWACGHFVHFNCKKISIRKLDTTGLECIDPKTSMKLVFHVILPLPYWEWDKASHMHIRFGHSKLGDWKVDCGDFEKAR